jgi:hypothetical protein
MVRVLNLFRQNEVRIQDIKHQVRVLLVLVAVVVLQVVEGMMVVVPGADDETRIMLTVKVLEAVKSRSNLGVNDPLEMKTRDDLRCFSQMKVRVVDQSTMRILCSLMKPDEFAAVFFGW